MDLAGRHGCHLGIVSGQLLMRLGAVEDLCEGVLGLAFIWGKLDPRREQGVHHRGDVARVGRIDYIVALGVKIFS